MITSPIELADFDLDRLAPGSYVWKGNSISGIGTECAVEIRETTSGKVGARQRRTLVKVVRSQPNLEVGQPAESFTVNITTNGSAETSALSLAERQATVDLAMEVANATNGASNVQSKLMGGES